MGSHHQPICIPTRSSKFVVGTAKGVPHKGSFLLEGTSDGNLPSGVSINNTYVKPTKSGFVTVCLENLNEHNVWIHQPLYAGDLWDVDQEDWEYEPVLIHEAGTNNIEIRFQQVPPEHLWEEISAQAEKMAGLDPDKEKDSETMESETTPKGNSESEDQEKPTFGQRPDSCSPDFDFKKELEHLPFKINI